MAVDVRVVNQDPRFLLREVDRRPLVPLFWQEERADHGADLRIAGRNLLKVRRIVAVVVDHAVGDERMVVFYFNIPYTCFSHGLNFRHGDAVCKRPWAAAVTIAKLSNRLFVGSSSM